MSKINEVAELVEKGKAKTVAMITLPSAPVEPDARCGFRTSTPFFIARAATSISGTKISPFLNFSPTTDIALIIPSFRIATGSSPSSMASCTAGPTNFAFR